MTYAAAKVCIATENGTPSKPIGRRSNGKRPFRRRSKNTTFGLILPKPLNMDASKCVIVRNGRATVKVLITSISRSSFSRPEIKGAAKNSNKEMRILPIRTPPREWLMIVVIPLS